jgi:hypothetical protein
LGRAGNPSRDLRSDQKGGNDGRNADKSKELIHRKHIVVPQDNKAGLIRLLRHPLIAGQNLVGPGRSGNREQRKNRDDGERFHGGESRSRLWPKMSELGTFSGQTKETSWPGGGTPPPAINP